MDQKKYVCEGCGASMMSDTMPEKCEKCGGMMKEESNDSNENSSEDTNA